MLASQFAKLAVPAVGRVGVAATLVETGETVSLAGAERFPMQSVFKLPIALAVIHEVEQGRFRWSQPVRLMPADMRGGHSPLHDQHPQGIELTLQELIRYMVTESDNSACDKLLSLLGGPAAVTRYLRTLGLTQVVVATTEGGMAQDELAQYRNWATPVGMNQLLVVLHKGRTLQPANRALLLGYLTSTPRGQKRLKGRLPAGTVVAHKTGASGTHDGLTRATNDVGLITLPNGRHLAMSVFIADSKASEAVREDVIAQAAQVAYRYWSNSTKP
ncbi:class A beta-lactamase [Hymenobacter properus]|uniref:class A beta-lactamase n=1 Tax=Hymenobacter properus TaxID=2791026 RepID=UPI001B81BDB7|nr:class A beta-lactamase [Hymenobacter properus]MBR7722397.1 class A beta-lactamase [Microvirga sp. SRT04]